MGRLLHIMYSLNCTLFHVIVWNCQFSYMLRKVGIYGNVEMFCGISLKQAENKWTVKYQIYVNKTNA